MQINVSIILLSVCFLACGTHPKELLSKPNDTTKVLKLALQQSISDSVMPDADGLIDTVKLHDTILLASDCVPFRLLPSSIDKVHFKLLHRAEMRAFIAREFNRNYKIRYLYLTAFEKNDSGYYVNVECISGGEYSSGGGLGLYYKNEKDSFVLKDKSTVSIN